MQIANPIYDVVFKYLLEDNKIARLFISAIIGEKIVSLEFGSTEVVGEIEANLTVYRIDFKAIISTAEGEKAVIIEIQKAKLPTDIMRFRKYLAEQYASGYGEVREASVPYGKAIPIISIYFLGHTLQYTKAPVVKVARQYIDLTTGEVISKKEVFIESLTHDSYVIQIPYLKDKRKTDLLKLLSIFDQSQREKDFHILNVSEDDFPEQYKPVVRRLQKAIMVPKLRKKMELEDEISSVLKNMGRTIAEQKKAIEEKDRIIEALKKKLKGGK